MNIALFFVLSAFALIFALAVVLAKNPIRSALALIGLLLSTAGLFGLLNAGFVAVLQVLVYAGAVMVLFVFVIMLLNLKKTTFSLRTIEGYQAIGAIMAVVAGGLLLWIMLKYQLLGGVSHLPVNFGSVESVGNLLFGKYFVAFETAGVLLFAAIVGGVVLAKRKL